MKTKRGAPDLCVPVRQTCQFKLPNIPVARPFDQIPHVYSVDVFIDKNQMTRRVGVAQRSHGDRSELPFSFINMRI